MTVKLTEQLKKDLHLIDPYFSQKQQMRICGVCINTMMKLRDLAGLNKKKKGRPTGTPVLFKGEKAYPPEVEEALKRIPLEIKSVSVE